VGLWETRPVVEKHFQLALYHPAVESIASILCDLPNKFLLTFAFNIPFYFLANLRRTPSAFFTFYLFAFVSLVAGSMLFRTIGAMSRTLTGSIAPGAVFVGALTIYTGFVLPIPYMHPWFRWFTYINPVAYAFESLMINEASSYPCTLKYASDSVQ
jgi:ATP-binding cassette subfamily G (WHITE) protein 2 (PDR)